MAWKLLGHIPLGAISDPLLGWMSSIPSRQAANHQVDDDSTGRAVAGLPLRNLNGGLPKLGVPFWGSYNKDSSILGSILGSPYLGKLPNQVYNTMSTE